MNKAIKWLLITLLGLIVLFAIAAAIFIATFNPNSYKAKLESYVLDNYSRELLINGDVGLSVFPNLALQISDVSLSEPNSKDKFAAIKDARLSVAMMPLLSKQVEIDHVSISGLDATIIKNKEGNFNFNDLLGKSLEKATGQEQSGTPSKSDAAAIKSDLAINVAGIEIKDSQIIYLDKSSGLSLNIYEIQATTGAISLGTPFSTTVQALINSNQPQLAVHLDLTSQVTLSNNYQDIALKNLVIKTSGDLANLKQIKSDLQGDVNLNNGAVLANNLQFNLTGDLAGEKSLSGINLQLGGGQINLQPKESGLSGDLAFNRATYKDTVRDIQITDIATNFKSDSSGVQLNNIKANLYEGSLAGQFSSNKNNQIGLKLDLQQIALQALLKSLSAKDLLAGRGFVQLDINAAGKDIKSIEKSLTGKVALQVKEGAVLGVNVRQTLIDVSELIGNISSIKDLRLDQVKSPFSPDAQTAFSKFDLLINLKNGQGNISNLLMVSELFDVTQGDPAHINVPEQSMNILLNAKISDDLPKSSKMENIMGITLPVLVRGSWAHPQYSVKLENLLRDQVVKSVIESGIDKLLGNDTATTDQDSGETPSKEEVIGKALKGLFGG